MDKRSFKARMKDTGYLLKNSFTLLGKEEDLKKPTINMAIYSSIMVCIVFFFIFTLILGKLLFVSIPLFLICIFILFPIKFFYYSKQKAMQSLITYYTLRGADINIDQAKQGIKNSRGKIRGIATISFLISFLGTKEGKGIRGLIRNILVFALKEIWDLLSHYMIPAVVIENKKLKECIVNIKSLKNNVPAALVGVFGIDFAGGIISSFVIIIGLPSIIIGILLSVWLSSLLPITIILFLLTLILSIANKFVESVKIIYFTILYTSINHSQEIVPEIRNEVTNYLLMNK